MFRGVAAIDGDSVGCDIYRGLSWRPKDDGHWRRRRPKAPSPIRLATTQLSEPASFCWGSWASLASSTLVSPRSFPPIFIVGISPRFAPAYELWRPRPKSRRPSAGTRSVKGTSVGVVDFLAMSNRLRFMPVDYHCMLDCANTFMYICNAINQMRDHGRKTEARAPARCGKDGNALGQDFRRGAAAVGSGGEKSPAQVVPRGRGAPRIYARSVWHRPAGSRQGFGRAHGAAGRRGRAGNGRGLGS